MTEAAGHPASPQRAADGAGPVRTSSGVPPQVVWLGLVSLLTDVSSEMIFAVLPIFLTEVLGATALMLGVMEGLADFAASSLDMAAGFISDRVQKRKPFAVLGYGISTVAKVFLVSASTVFGVVAFRVIERLGKSVRGAPRDAMLASISPGTRRGTSFGLHKAMDKAGAVIGPLVAYAILDRWGRSAAGFRVLFVSALAPAVISVGTLALAVRERAAPARSRFGLRSALGSLGPEYRHYLTSAALFSGAYFSFAFLLLAAGRAGFAPKTVALLYGLHNLAFVVASVPVGRLGDRIGRRAVVAASYALYAAVAIGFATLHSPGAVVALFAAAGIFFAIDEGQTKAYITDLTVAETRATALGVYGFVTALVYLPASILAGLLWRVSPDLTFGGAAAIATVAMVYFLAFAPAPRSPASTSSTARGA